jgi:antirestriction protein ArdC
MKMKGIAKAWIDRIKEGWKKELSLYGVGDRKNCPTLKDETNTYGFYCKESDEIYYLEQGNENSAFALFHELIHATGHKKRLNRRSLTNYGARGNKKIEEGIAIWGAYELCRMAGIRMNTNTIFPSYSRWLNLTLKMNYTKSQAKRMKTKTIEAVEYISKVAGLGEPKAIRFA